MATENEVLAADAPSPPEPDTLQVTVHYPAAVEPFRDRVAERSETLSHLKGRVLATFRLTEESSPDGTTVTYVLYHRKERLDDLGQTLGHIAGEHPALQLKLAQELTQG